MRPDFYSQLGLPRDASRNEVKAAYHRTLLRLHPDKQSQPHHRGANAATDPPGEASVDMALLKEAHRTLSDAGLRAAYDASLRHDEHARSRGPRPSQVVSLDEFTIEMGPEADASQESWHRCRCGGLYRITQADLENGTHLVGCESCSEAIWVGYEEADDEVTPG